MKTLNEKTIDGKTYTYFTEHKDGILVSTDFYVKMTKTPQLVDTFKKMNGILGQLFTVPENVTDFDSVAIFTITANKGAYFTVVSFEKENEIVDYQTISDPMVQNITQYMILEERRLGDDFVVQSTIEQIQQPKYELFLNTHYSFPSVNAIGLSFAGKELSYNDTIIVDFEEEQLGTLFKEDFLKSILGKAKKLQFGINSNATSFNTVAKMYFLDENFKRLTEFDLENTTNLSFEDFVEKEFIDKLHEIACRIESKLERAIKDDKFKERKQRLIERHCADLDTRLKDLKCYLNDAFYENVSMAFLNVVLKKVSQLSIPYTVNDLESLGVRIPKIK